MNLPQSAATKLPIAVLISGHGSNLQAIIDATQKDLPAEICVVISDRENAHGLTRAKQAGISTEVVKATKDMSREDYDRKLQDRIDHYQPGLIVLAGFMRILSDNFVTHYSGKMINIHPSLLPKFRGLNTHQRAIDAGETWHGASVRVPIHASDTAETLANHVLQQEHQIYPLAIRWFADSRLECRNEQAYFDKQLLTKPIQFPVEPNVRPQD
ncbi:MAG: phosphoribosylglycinamide formyltransferase [Gammaproteobacteria bacterium]